jgi:hypothetical protein
MAIAGSRLGVSTGHRLSKGTLFLRRKAGAAGGQAPGKRRDREGAKKTATRYSFRYSRKRTTFKMAATA